MPNVDPAAAGSSRFLACRAAYEVSLPPVFFLRQKKRIPSSAATNADFLLKNFMELLSSVRG
jgi:hypothetical protein